MSCLNNCLTDRENISSYPFAKMSDLSLCYTGCSPNQYVNICKSLISILTKYLSHEMKTMLLQNMHTLIVYRDYLLSSAFINPSSHANSRLNFSTDIFFSTTAGIISHVSFTFPPQSVWSITEMINLMN